MPFRLRAGPNRGAVGRGFRYSIMGRNYPRGPRRPIKVWPGRRVEGAKAAIYANST